MCPFKTSLVQFHAEEVEITALAVLCAGPITYEVKHLHCRVLLPDVLKNRPEMFPDCSRSFLSGRGYSDETDWACIWTYLKHTCMKDDLLVGCAEVDILNL